MSPSTAVRKQPPRFSAAIFDLDGTVTDSAPLHLQTFNQLLKEYGITIRKETWFSLYEGTGSKHIFEDALLKHGLLGKVDVELLRKRRRALFKEVALTQLLPVRGFGRFYDILRELQIPSIIATNGEPENVRLSLRILKLDEEQVITASDVGNKVKPDPSVYLAACKRLGLPPARCVVFEDSVSGVTAAKRAGCYCACVLTTTPREKLERAGADLVVEDFTRLTPSMFFERKGRL